LIRRGWLETGNWAFEAAVEIAEQGFAMENLTVDTRLFAVPLGPRTLPSDLCDIGGPATKMCSTDATRRLGFRGHRFGHNGRSARACRTADGRVSLGLIYTGMAELADATDLKDGELCRTRG